jgi:hypothetical protein
MYHPSLLLTWRSLFLCSQCEYPPTLVPGRLSTVLLLLLNPPRRHPRDQVTYLHRRHQQQQPIRLIHYFLSFHWLKLSSFFLPLIGISLHFSYQLAGASQEPSFIQMLGIIPKDKIFNIVEICGSTCSIFPPLKERVRYHVM